jgi:hypothetical protein
MWIISTSIAAIITTAIWYIKDPQGKYKLNTLSLMLWGATLMMFIDGMMGFRSEGSFLDLSLTPTILAIIVVIAALTAWEVVLFITDPQGVFKKQRQTKAIVEKQLAEAK